MSISFKTFLCGLIGTIVVVGLFNILLDVTGIGARGNDRVFESLDHVRAIASEHTNKKKALVLGSSVTQVSFSPYEFDRRLGEHGIEMMSYNYGFGGLNPKIQEVFSRQFIENFKSANTNEKLDLAILEFNPFQTTIARKNLDAYIEDRNFSLLMSGKQILAMIFDDPTRAIRLLNIKYLRQGFSAELLTNGFGSMIVGMPRIGGSPEYDQYQAELNVIEEKYETAREKEIPGNFNRGRWFKDMRGGRMNIHGLSPDTFSLLQQVEVKKQNPMRMQSYVDYRVFCCDILELHFDQELLDRFIDLVNNYKEISHNVRVLLYPIHQEYILYSPETQARLKTALDYISQKTNVPVDNFQLIPEINTSHFVDESHLTISDGTVIFSEYLAEKYLPLLQ